MKYPILLLLLINLIACTPNSKVYVSGFTAGIEGPYMDPQGNLFVVNYQQEGTISKTTPDGKTEIFARLPREGVGNSIQYWNDSLLIVADYVQHIIWHLNLHTREFIPWVTEEEMNQPNDLAVHPSGWIYASDPNWKNSTGNLWLIHPEGLTALLADSMGTTNGLAVSKDGKYLFVNESVQRKIWRFEVMENGTLMHKTLIRIFEDAGLDGMKTLTDGSILVARYDAGEIVKLSQEGEDLKKYPTQGKKPTNLCVDNTEKWLFVTLQDTQWVEKIKL